MISSRAFSKLMAKEIFGEVLYCWVAACQLLFLTKLVIKTLLQISEWSQPVLSLQALLSQSVGRLRWDQRSLKLMNPNQTVTIIFFMLHIFAEKSPKATNSLTSSSSKKVSFINSSSVLKVDVGREAILECLIQNLANNHLVRKPFSTLFFDW